LIVGIVIGILLLLIIIGAIVAIVIIRKRRNGNTEKENNNVEMKKKENPYQNADVVAIQVNGELNKKDYNNIPIQSNVNNTAPSSHYANSTMISPSSMNEGVQYANSPLSKQKIQYANAPKEVTYANAPDTSKF